MANRKPAGRRSISEPVIVEVAKTRARRRFRSRDSLILLIVSAATFIARPAHAQLERPKLEVSARVSAHLPLIDLGKSTDPEEDVQIRSKLKVAPAIGLTLQYNPTVLPMRFRASFHYTPDTEAEAEPAPCAILTGPGCRRVSVDARFFSLTADVVFAPLEETRTTHFYFLLGLGLKRHEFGSLICPDDDIVCDLLNDFVRNQTRPTVHLALGLNFKIGPVRSFLEVGDHMSRFQPSGERSGGEIQQDVFVSTGVRFPFF